MSAPLQPQAVSPPPGHPGGPFPGQPQMAQQYAGAPGPYPLQPYPAPQQQQQQQQYGAQPHHQQPQQPGFAPGQPQYQQTPAMMTTTAPGPAPPMHTATNSQQFKVATPIAGLGRSAAPVDCPSCGQRALTTLSHKTGNSTHAWAAGLCCCLCLGCIPYLINDLKDVEHKCGSCGVSLATWHRSGTTEVHLHG